MVSSFLLSRCQCRFLVEGILLAVQGAQLVWGVFRAVAARWPRSHEDLHGDARYAYGLYSRMRARVYVCVRAHAGGS